MEQIFIQLAIILLTAFVVSYIVRAFRQPIIIGYIIAGMIISPFILEFGASKDLIHIFSEFGIAFLLFIVGLHLNPKVIKEIGFSSLIIGLVQILLTFTLGFVVALNLLNFDVIASCYIGVALAFSSTIIITKLLSDKRQLDSLYGKISIGILIIQDLVAIAALMFISSISNGTSFSSFATKTLFTGAGLIIILFLFGFFILSRMLKGIAKSQELLFLFSICWCFLVAGLFTYFGFSIEIGALVAGIVLSISPYSTEISAKIRPLRDFFLIIFFIILGLNIPFQEIKGIAIAAIVLSAIVLIFKPLFLMTLMAIFGYTKRTNFLVGTTLAQISEFSIIILTLGLSKGHIGPEVVHTIALTLIITIVLSTYLIMHSKEFYKFFFGFISFFERKKVKKEKVVRKNYDAILFGYNRIGFNILRSLKKIKKKYLVVDFNPDTISALSKARIPCLYGDVFDNDLLKDLPLDKVKIVVSTIPDFDTNFLLIESVRLVNPNAIVIVRAHQIQDALDLYKKGANYVLTPHFLGGEYVSKMIRHVKTSKEGYKDEKKNHIRILERMMGKGHEHPTVDRD
jgi:Kef-type K+ transport system membrane component KefB